LTSIDEKNNNNMNSDDILKLLTNKDLKILNFKKTGSYYMFFECESEETLKNYLKFLIKFYKILNKEIKFNENFLCLSIKKTIEETMVEEINIKEKKMKVLSK